jgi:hypothetical protein
LYLDFLQYFTRNSNEKRRRQSLHKGGMEMEEKKEGALKMAEKPLVLDVSDERTLYANVVSVNVNLFDFVLDFGTRKPPEGEVMKDTPVRVYLSPAHAKVLAKLLQENVKAYEAEFGEIKTEPLKRKQ